MEHPTPSLAPFAWVQKRNGRLVPFEPDKISRALFAAGESLGRPDAFLARELTDGILHFLPHEAAGPTPTTTQIAEVVVKVVRELGQPNLARAFVEGQARKQNGLTPAESTDAAAAPEASLLGQVSEWVKATPPPGELTQRASSLLLWDFSLREVFTRDLVAAQADGLLTLTGLESPLELAGHVLAVPTDGPLAVVLLETLEDARSTAGRFVVLDGPEYFLTLLGRGVDTVPEFLRVLRLGLRTTRLEAVLNLNMATPPPWAEGLAEGPLFSSHRRSVRPERLAEVVEALTEQSLLDPSLTGSIRVHFHLGQRDFLAEAAPRLLRLARRSLDGAPLDFVFDRPRRPVSLAEGIDRRHPAVLTAVRLHLPRLLDQLGADRTPARFLQKLGSLARLGLSAGTQKREFLRRHTTGRPGLTRGFVLDRARLVAVPVGLDAVTRGLTGRGTCSGGPALDVARQVVVRLEEVLRHDGGACHLDTCVDGEVSTGPSLAETTGSPSSVAGVTAWEPGAAPASQLKATGLLHAAAGGGTAVLQPGSELLSAEDLVALLREAWQRTELNRVRILPRAQSQQQLTAAWESGAG
jgi:hypothetical protein